MECIIIQCRIMYKVADREWCLLTLSSYQKSQDSNKYLSTTCCTSYYIDFDCCQATRGKKAESSLCLPSEFLRGFSTTFDTFHHINLQFEMYPL